MTGRYGSGTEGSAAAGGASALRDGARARGLPSSPSMTGSHPFLAALLATGALLAVYFVMLTLISGWRFTVEQFSAYWYYVLALAAGFGIQIGLYVRLRAHLHGTAAHRTVVAASGTTSTAAMVSCCAHYAANILPVVGATGLVTVAAQYQVQLFWIGLAFNAAGIAFIASRLSRAAKEHAECAST